MIHTRDSCRTNAFVCNFGHIGACPVSRTDPVCMRRDSRQSISRRTLIQTVLALPAIFIPYADNPALASSTDIEEYDVLKSRRYVDIGPPPPSAEVPKFLSSIPVFSIDDKLQAQDISAGEGAPVTDHALVVARWIIRLSDGTMVDDSNARRPSLFRPQAHQVAPGIEDSVVGMKKGGHRLVSGSAERILT